MKCFLNLFLYFTNLQRESPKKPWKVIRQTSHSKQTNQIFNLVFFQLGVM